MKGRCPVLSYFFKSYKSLKLMVMFVLVEYVLTHLRQIMKKDDTFLERQMNN